MFTYSSRNKIKMTDIAEDVERTQSCSINNFCRLCANADDNMISIYADEGADHMLENKINTHLPFIKLCQNDLLPKRICYHCASAVLVWDELYECSGVADLKLRSIFEASEPYDQNQCKSVSYSDIEGIPVPEKDFIGESIEYEEITDVNMFSKNGKSDNTLNELDKNQSTSKTDSILNHEDKSPIIQEDERLNPPIKSGISNIFDRVDDDDSEDHNMYLDAVRLGMDDDMNGLMNCHTLDMAADDCSLVVPKREYLSADEDEDNGCMDVDQTECKSLVLSTSDDISHHQEQEDLMEQQEDQMEQQEDQMEQQEDHQEQDHQQDQQQQQQHHKRRRKRRRCRSHHPGEDDDDSTGAIAADSAVAADDDESDFKCQMSSLMGGDEVDQLLKCQFNVEANGVGGRHRVARGRRRLHRTDSFVDDEEDDEDEDEDDVDDGDDDRADDDRADGDRADDDDNADDDADEDADEDDEDDDDSAVVDDDCDPMNVEVRQMYMSSLEEEDAGGPSSPEHETMCQICATVFKTRYNLLRHFQKRHPEFKMYECDLCRISFPSINEFKEHLEQKHSKVQQAQAAVGSKQVRFACDVCGNMYKNKASAMNHLLTHTAKKTVRCPHCEFTCYTKQQLGVHQTKHDKRFVCDICHKRFAQKSQLDVHINAVHYNQRPFACVLCNKSFKTKGSHDAHMIVHTDTRNYQCPHCDKKCRKRYDLTLHIRTHTGEKPFKCSVCGRGFVQMCDTRKHEMLHFKPGKRKNAFFHSLEPAGGGGGGSPVEDE